MKFRQKIKLEIKVGGEYYVNAPWYRGYITIQQFVGELRNAYNSYKNENCWTAQVINGAYIHEYYFYKSQFIRSRI